MEHNDELLVLMTMDGMSWMRWAGGLFWVLVLVLLMLATAASVKHLVGNHERQHDLR